MEVTSPKCELIVLIHNPDPMSQIFIVLSLDLQIKCLINYKNKSHTH